MEHTTQKRRRPSRRPYAGWYVLIALAVVLLVGGAILLTSYLTADFTLSLKGDSAVTLEFGQAFEDPGVDAHYAAFLSASDGTDAQIQVSAQPNLQQLGKYSITYTATYRGKTATAERTVTVVDTQKPTISLIYNSNSFTLPGQPYEEEGFAAEDNYDGDLTDKVERMVDGDTVIYRVTDSSGNTAQVTRPIKYGDHTPPVLELKGDTTITISAGGKFTDPGYTATDNVDGDVTAKVTVSKDHNTSVPGTYTITYAVTDTYGNTSTVTRTLVVKAVEKPDVVEPSGKVIYLTFDDGPGPYTRQLLDVLKKHNVKATFFVCDKGATYNKLMKDIVDEGHAIAIHSATHDYNKIYASEEAFFNDLNKMSDIIYNNTGVRTTLMRFPGGSSNMVSKFNPGIMTRLTKMVEERGYQYFDWNVDSDDAGGSKTTDKVFYNVVHGKNDVWRGCEDGKVSIVLQHDIHKYSVEAVEQIIQWGLDNGYQFLPLDSTSPTAHHSVNN